MKKLRVTVNGVSYDVDVEILEDDDEGAGYGFEATAMPRSRPAAPARPAAAPAATPAATPKAAPAAAPSGGGAGEVPSPIAGIIVEYKVSVGASFKKNDVLVIVEAMKMNTNINAPADGTVKEIKGKSGEAVKQGQVLLTYE